MPDDFLGILAICISAVMLVCYFSVKDTIRREQLRVWFKPVAWWLAFGAVALAPGALMPWKVAVAVAVFTHYCVAKT